MNGQIKYVYIYMSIYIRFGIYIYMYICVYIYMWNIIQPQEEGNPIICNNMNGSGGHYVK